MNLKQKSTLPQSQIRIRHQFQFKVMQLAPGITSSVLVGLLSTPPFFTAINIICLCSFKSMYLQTDHHRSNPVNIEALHESRTLLDLESCFNYLQPFKNPHKLPPNHQTSYINLVGGLEHGLYFSMY